MVFKYRFSDLGYLYLLFMQLLFGVNFVHDRNSLDNRVVRTSVSRAVDPSLAPS